MVILKFNKKILEIKNLTAIDEKVFQMRVIPGPESNKEDLKITSWNVQEMRETEIIIQLVFEKPLSISS